MKSLPVFSATALVLCFLIPLTTGCGGGNGGSKSGSGGKAGGSGGLAEPTWLQVDSSKFLPLEGLDKDMDRDKDGTARIRVYDPKGWRLLANPGSRGERGIFVAGFQKDGDNLQLWGTDSRIDYLTEADLPEVAAGVQEKFKTPVRMVKLGDIYGVAFNFRTADPKRPGHFFTKAVVMTVLNNRMYTFEALSRGETLKPDLRYALYTFVASTKMLKLGDDGEMVEYSVPKVSRPEAPVVAAAEPVAPVKTTPATATVEPTPAPDEPTVAAVTPKSDPAPAAKPEPTPAPAAKPAAPAKAATKSILDELDDLLN